jgi:hypothetical protein
MWTPASSSSPQPETYENGKTQTESNPDSPDRFTYNNPRPLQWRIFRWPVHRLAPAIRHGARSHHGRRPDKRNLLDPRPGPKPRHRHRQHSRGGPPRPPPQARARMPVPKHLFGRLASLIPRLEVICHECCSHFDFLTGLERHQFATTRFNGPSKRMQINLDRTWRLHQISKKLTDRVLFVANVRLSVTEAVDLSLSPVFNGDKPPAIITKL